MPWYDNITTDFSWQIEDRGIDDWLGDFLRVGMTDRSWDHLAKTEQALYGDPSNLPTQTLPGANGTTIEVYESNGKIFDAQTGEPVQQINTNDPSTPNTFPVWGTKAEGGSPTSSGGIQSAIDAITGAITGATGGSQNPNTIWDPINRQYGQGTLKKILGGAVFNELVNTSGLGYEQGAAVNPVQSPETSTYGGAPGPVKEVPAIFPTPTQPVTGEVPETGTPLRRYPGTVQTPVQSPTIGDNTIPAMKRYAGTFQTAVPSPETSTDTGDGGPRRGTETDTPDPREPPNLDNIFDMEAYDRRDQVSQMDVWDEAQLGTPKTAQTLSGILDAESVINPRQIQGYGRDYGDVLRQLTGYGDPNAVGMGGYGQTATGIGDLDIDLDRKKREEMLSFFTGGGYGDMLGGMQESDPGTFGMINDLQEQSGMMSNQISSLIGNAGKLNERERSNVQDQTRALFGARGRGTDTAAIATEIGDVLEAERFDRNQDLGMASNLMGQQGQLAGLSSGLQNQFVNSFLGANQSIMPGLGTAEGMKGTASSMGIDPGAIFNLALGERGYRNDLEMAYENADSIREAGMWEGIGNAVQPGVEAGWEWLLGKLGG